MGKVYKARDTRLDRAVAIKILPDDFARDAPLKVRFEREARTISQLSHRNIRVDMSEYDVAPDGQHFLINTTAGRHRSLPLTVAVGWQPGAP